MIYFEPNRVLCALDLGEPVDGLLETATSIASRFDARLHLLHVWNPWRSVGPDGAFLPVGGELEALSRTLAEQLAAVTREARTVCKHVESSLVAGTPWEQIVLFAETTACDLIVAGTHGRTGLAHLVHGSVAERVVRESSIPVLIVPTSKPTGASARTSEPPRRPTPVPGRVSLPQ